MQTPLSLTLRVSTYLSVIDVTNGANIYMRFGSVKFYRESSIQIQGEALLLASRRQSTRGFYGQSRKHGSSQQRVSK
jgi:hypothetical protein